MVCRVLQGWDLRLFAGALLLLLSGCAVQQGPGGSVKIGIDDAEIFGQKVGEFKLADGGEGSLRVFNRKYSLKLHNLAKIIALPEATMAKIVRADIVDGRTVVVLEIARAGCNHKYYLFSFRGSDALQWEMGDCVARPTTSATDLSVLIEFPLKLATARFTYKDMRLFRRDVPLQSKASAALPSDPQSGSTYTSPTRPANKPASANQPSTNLPATQRRYTPSLPIQIASSSDAEKAANSTTSAVGLDNPPSTAKPSSVKGTPPTLPPALPRLEFPVQEQKPIRINLEK